MLGDSLLGPPEFTTKGSKIHIGSVSWAHGKPSAWSGMNLSGEGSLRTALQPYLSRFDRRGRPQFWKWLGVKSLERSSRAVVTPTKGTVCEPPVAGLAAPEISSRAREREAAGSSR